MAVVELTEQEMFVLQWQFPRFFFRGSFQKAIADAIAYAGDEDLEKLSLAYPKWVAGINCYRHQEGWWDALKVKAKAANLIPQNAD